MEDASFKPYYKWITFNTGEYGLIASNFGRWF